MDWSETKWLLRESSGWLELPVKVLTGSNNDGTDDVADVTTSRGYLTFFCKKLSLGPGEKVIAMIKHREPINYANEMNEIYIEKEQSNHRIFTN